MNRVTFSVRVLGRRLRRTLSADWSSSSSMSEGGTFICQYVKYLSSSSAALTEPQALPVAHPSLSFFLPPFSCHSEENKYQRQNHK